METNKTMAERAHIAAKKFLERKGLEILDDNPNLTGIDLAAKEGDIIAFIEVIYREGSEKGFSDTHSLRNTVEQSAAKWLAGQDETDIRCRFDRISMMIISPQRAFLRYHINALGSSEA